MEASVDSVERLVRVGSQAGLCPPQRASVSRKDGLR